MLAMLVPWCLPVCSRKPPNMCIVQVWPEVINAQKLTVIQVHRFIKKVSPCIYFIYSFTLHNFIIIPIFISITLFSVDWWQSLSNCTKIFSCLRRTKSTKQNAKKCKSKINIMYCSFPDRVPGRRNVQDMFVVLQLNIIYMRSRNTSRIG